MKKAIFYNGDKKLNILVPESIDEKYRGMKVFKSEKDCEYDGMMFEFGSDIDYMTMNGMKFPLTMVFLEKDMSFINQIDAEIDDDNIPIPERAKSCLELIKDLSFYKDKNNRVEITNDQETRFKKLSKLIRELF
jgi:uncharacterized membrane protein (UPF0127 family)